MVSFFVCHESAGKDTSEVAEIDGIGEEYIIRNSRCTNTEKKNKSIGLLSVKVF